MDLVTSLLRPFARTWLQHVQGELSLLPAPASSLRQHIAGPETDRVLVFGNGVASGFGVITQELGLPGQLARELVARTGRGVEVDLAGGRGTTITSAHERLALLRLWRYDAVVVTVGATDASGLLPEDRWEQGLHELIDLIGSRAGVATPIVLLGIRPQATAVQGVGVMNRLVDRHAADLDAVSAQVASRAPSTEYVAIEPALRALGEKRYFSPDSYRAIAERIADALVPSLDRLHQDGTWAQTRLRRDEPGSEQDRQRAVDDSGVTASPGSERLQRLVQSASRLFGTSGAALTIIDGDRQWHKASVGLDVDELPRRRAICDRTIQRDGPMIIADATTDPQTAGTDMRANGEPVRFYAGYPIESPDGYRLGALCVFDGERRDPAEIDEVQLRDLALRVQNELWEQQGWAPVV